MLHWCMTGSAAAAGVQSMLPRHASRGTQRHSRWQPFPFLAVNTGRHLYPGQASVASISCRPSLLCHRALLLPGGHDWPTPLPGQASINKSAAEPSSPATEPFSFLVVMTERHPFLGKIVTGRIHSGSVAVGDRMKVLWKDGEGLLQGAFVCLLGDAGCVAAKCCGRMVRGSGLLRKACVCLLGAAQR